MKYIILLFALILFSKGDVFQFDSSLPSSIEKDKQSRIFSWQSVNSSTNYYLRVKEKKMIKIIMLLMTILSVQCYGVKIRDNEVTFTFEDKSLTQQKRNIISNEVCKIFLPVIECSYVEQVGDNDYVMLSAFKFDTFSSNIFSPGSMTNDIVYLPISKRFSDEYTNKERLLNKYNGSYELANVFISKLRTLDISKLSFEEKLAMFLFEEDILEDVEEDGLDVFLNHIKEFEPCDISKYSFIENKKGPNNKEHLWMRVILKDGPAVKTIPLIFYEGEWRISYWGSGLVGSFR